MARVGYPLLSYDVRGKFGQIVFYKRDGKQYARIRVKPRNPRTPAQMLVRENTRRLMQAWAGAGSDVRTDSQGRKFVWLTSYNPYTMQYTQYEFEVLTDAEKEEWRKKYGSYAIVNFSGTNIRRLLRGEQAIRTPQ